MLLKAPTNSFSVSLGKRLSKGKPMVRLSGYSLSLRPQNEKAVLQASLGVLCVG